MKEPISGPCMDPAELPNRSLVEPVRKVGPERVTAP